MKIFNYKKPVDKIAKDFVSIESVSENEKELADLIEKTLKTNKNLIIKRISNTIYGQNKNNLKEKSILLAGHIDTVPISKNTNNFPAKIIDDKYLWGRGSVDMKSSLAAIFKVTCEIGKNTKPVKFVFYESEEIEAEKSGIQKIIKKDKSFFKNIKYAIVGEPSDVKICVGCKGIIKADINIKGKAGHVAYSGGENAIHAQEKILKIFNDTKRAEPKIDGHVFPETLNAVKIEGGIAENVIPDTSKISINYRYAPNKTPIGAEKYLRNLFKGYTVKIRENSSASLPNIKKISEFINATKMYKLKIVPKMGWTDVATFSMLGIPALNFGCGNPSLSHTDNEKCSLKDIVKEYEILSKLINE